MISLDVPDIFSQQLGQFKKLPHLFLQYDLDSPFLMSFWSNIVMLGVVSCVFTLSRALLSRRKTRGWGCSLLEKLVVGSRNFLLVQVYGGLDDVQFYFVLDVRTNPFNKSVFPWMSFICGVAFVGLGGWLIFFNVLTVKRYQRIKHENQRNLEIFHENNKTWEVLYSDFNDDDSWSQSFFALLVIRSSLSSLIITTLSKVVVIQTAFLVIMDGVILIFVMAKKPLVKFRTTLAQYFFEFIALFVHICVFILSLQNDQGGNLRSGVCKSLIYLNKTLVFGGSTLMIVEISQTVGEKIKIWKSSKKKKYQQGRTTVAAVHPIILENSITQNGLLTVEPVDLTDKAENPTSKSRIQRRFQVSKDHKDLDSSIHFEGSLQGRKMLCNDVTNNSFLQQENNDQDKDDEK